MLSQTQGERSNARDVNVGGTWASSSSNSEGRWSGVPGGEGVPEDERGRLVAVRRRRGALVQVRQRRRWRARMTGVGGGLTVQF